MKLRPGKFIFTHFAPYSSQEGPKCSSNRRSVSSSSKCRILWRHSPDARLLPRYQGWNPHLLPAYELVFPSSSLLTGNKDDPGATCCFFTPPVLLNTYPIQPGSMLLETRLSEHGQKGGSKRILSTHDTEVVPCP